MDVCIWYYIKLSKMNITHVISWHIYEYITPMSIPSTNSDTYYSYALMSTKTTWQIQQQNGDLDQNGRN
jgi:hypothetical protein